MPEFYRNSTKHLWPEYGLIGKGAFKKDISMLFVARCHALYANTQGKLAFLVPFTTFKNPSGGGYRLHLANKCDVERIHDLVELYPFEGAINRTAMIVLKEGKSQFPLHCVVWSNPSGKAIDVEAELEVVKRTTRQFNMIFAPIEKGKAESAWMVISQKGYDAVQKVLGESNYVAQEGMNTRGANAIFYVNLLEKQNDQLLISNNTEEGKKKFRQSRRLVENDLVFPLIRGSESKKWYARPRDYVVIPHNQETGEVIPEERMKMDFPNTFGFLSEFKNQLESRKFYGKGIRNRFPFYTLFQVNQNSFSKYKVIWKSIAGKISGKPQFDSTVIQAVDDKYLEENKGLIPNDSLVFIPFDNIAEAFYCAAVLNSSIVKLIVASYAIETRIPPSITHNVYIPQFDPSKKLHSTLSSLSKKAHELATKHYEQKDLVAQDEIRRIEDQIDEAVALLYGVTNEELEDIKRTLKILIEGESEVEEIIEEDVVVPRVRGLEVSIEPLQINEGEAKQLEVSIVNSSDSAIDNLEAEARFEGKLLASSEIERIDPNSSAAFSLVSPKLKNGEYELTVIVRTPASESTTKKKLFVSPRRETKKGVSALDDEIKRMMES